MSEALLNEIHVTFGALKTATTKRVSQWAYGQVLVIHDNTLPAVFEAYYSNSRTRGEAKPQIGTDGRVDVPDEYFLSGADIYVYIMAHEGAEDGRYEKVAHIPIDPCSKPSDVEPSPVQHNVIDQAIAALDNAVTQTGEDKEATAALAEAAAASSLIATQAAQSAQGSATSASGSATAASNAASTATTKAGEASASATAAGTAANRAEAAQTAAESAKTTAQSAQASAESAAGTATTKASEASASASSAALSASTASAKASEAEASATSASGSATAAAESATTASTKASEAAQSEADTVIAKNAAEAAQTAAEAAQGAAETARDEAVEEAASISGALDNKADVIIRSASGSIAHFEDGADNAPVKSLVVGIEPVQDLHGQDAPYPAGGGKNVFDQTVLKDQTAWNTIELHLKPNTQYTASTNMADTSALRIDFLLPTQTQGSGTKLHSGHPVTRTADENGILQIIQRQIENTDSFANYNFQIEEGSSPTTYAPYENICPITGRTGCEVVLSPTEDAEDGTTYTVSWASEAGTVYGGYVDLVNGDLVVRDVVFEVTKDTPITSDSLRNNIWRTRYDLPLIGANKNAISCSHFALRDRTSTASSYPQTNKICLMPYNEETAYVDFGAPSEITTREGWLSFLEEQGTIQVLYELAEPIRYPIDPVVLTTLKGINNIWTNAGDVELEYRADTKLYIDGKGTDWAKLIAPTEADYKATRAYTTGSLLIVGNQLYKATTSIANGATLTIGTNITATTLVEVIAAL